MITAPKVRGFTLIELMITVAIVGILAAVAYPSYIAYIAKGRMAECRGGLFQSMQQQERYFSQYNAYVTFAEGAVTATTKAFSGDSATNSACLMTSIACTAPGDTATTACIELRARPTFSLSGAYTGIGYLYLDSDGRKGCTVASTRTTSNTNCWPS